VPSERWKWARATSKADVVYGSRFLTTAERRVLYFWHWLGNAFLTLLCNAVADVNLTDMETGYKAFRAEVLHGLRLEQNRFGCEPEITMKVVRHQWRLYEVGISYSGRTYEEGKKVSWRDGIQALWCILKYGLSVPKKKGSRKTPGILPVVPPAVYSDHKETTGAGSNCHGDHEPS
jgi:hypothetical protein